MAIVKAQEASSSSPSPPSSSYSSTSRSSYTYDVFLSFRGEDTRKNFTDHLYSALSKKFRTFRDNDEIRRGKSLKPELDKAIEQSRVSIIVFSKSYASSTWCLDELVMILDRMKTSEHEVLPVFYDLSPSEARKQNGRTGEAFARHENYSEKEKVKRWRAALEEVANLAGMELQNEADGYESKFIQKIINWMGDKVSRTPFYVSPKLFGMDSRVKNINKWLQDDSSKVILRGICGMGGIGKTTIAEFVFNENYKSFDASCFLANVRERSEERNGLVGLQKQLLSCILNVQHKKIYNVNEGMIMIREAVSGKRVLLVLDDVNHINQLNALHGMKGWFFRGSKIIITTRDESLLKPFEAFKVEELSHDQSVELFHSYAFGEDSPSEGYKEHIKRVVQLCGGLPLALQVIGSSLSGRTIPYWASAVKKLEAIPPKEILDKLKISYDCLQDDSDKRVFLDIACFFVGDDKNDTIKVLDGIPDTYAAVGIQNLIDRYLLTIDSDKLKMHQLVRDMGRNIVHQESPEVLGERSRLWRFEDAYDVLENETGTRKIKGIVLDMRRLKEDGDTMMERTYEESLDRASLLTCICSFFHCFGCFNSFSGRQISTSSRISDMDLRTNAFEKMENLRLLKLNCTHLIGCYNNFPKKLVWLCWHGFPLKYVPIELPLNKLVALDLQHSKLEEVWAGSKILKSLKILNLSYSERLVKTPKFLGVPNLERLILKGCVSLIEICESIEFLQKLDLLDLQDCKNLKKLPRNMHKLESVGTLIISGCPTFFASRQDKRWCTSLLPPRPIRGPEVLWASLPCSLITLCLSWCNLSDDSLPCAFSNLSRLKNLDLSANSFCSLPDCVKSLSSLQWLSLSYCNSLDSVLGLPCNIQILDVACLSSTSLRRITFQSTPDQLDEINIWNCDELVEIEGILKREPIEKVDRRIIKNLGIDIESIKNLKVNRLSVHVRYESEPIQGIYEFGIFNTFIPGGEIPSCFNERKKGSSMSFIVSSVPKFTIQCLNICSVYTSTGSTRSIYPFVIKISNKTKDLTWVYYPMYLGTPDRGEEMTWLSQWNFGKQLEGGDEIVVSVLMSGYEVKECGINIVYEEEDNGAVSDDNNTTYFHWNEVVGGDLSRFQLSAGTYFLCRRLSRGRNSLRDMESYRNLFGDVAGMEEMQEWKVRCGFLDQELPRQFYAVF